MTGADHVYAGLKKLYAPPEWAFFSEVRSTTVSVDDPRYADGIAVNLYPSRGEWVLHGIEIKVSRADLVRELQHPEKSRPIRRLCSSWYLAVPAPWKRIVLALSDLPRSWGLIEVGTGAPSIVVASEERVPEPPEPGFVCSLLRAASTAAERAASPQIGTPMVPIGRVLSRSNVALACGHVVPRPLAKTLPPTVPCISCAEGHPTEREILEAAIGDASEDELHAFEALIEGRRRVAM